jgi:2-keto-4-pentenoate hydratase/2-oxohepta-3-ene-1,7-dioic acid hydratase in catechol pathway
MKLSVGSHVYTPSRIFCVGMNYVEHIRELKNEIPSSPVIFMKPTTCLVPPGGSIPFPAHGHELHYETELVVLIGQEGRPRTQEEARAAIGGISLGLDMTLRDVQQQLRSKGKPWELCKAFDHSAPFGHFAPLLPSMNLGALNFTGSVNGRITQQGTTSDLVFPIATLICYLAEIWTLYPGDLLYTGTPKGVGPVKRGDQLSVEAPWCGRFEWTIT